MKHPNYKPVRDKLLVRIATKKMSTAYGTIVVAGTTKEQKNAYGIFAEVIAVGPDCKDINAGEFIMLKNGQFSVFEFEGNKELYVYIEPYQIEAIVPDFEEHVDSGIEIIPSPTEFRLSLNPDNSIN